MGKEESKGLFEEKVIKNGGARHYLIRMEGEDNFKHHRYDEPAIVPLSRKSEFKKGWFLSGIEYDEETFNEITMADDDFVNGRVHDIAVRREGRREWGAREIRGRSAHLRRRGDEKEERGVAVFFFFFFVFSRVFVGVVGARQRGGDDEATNVARVILQRLRSIDARVRVGVFRDCREFDSRRVRGNVSQEHAKPVLLPKRLVIRLGDYDYLREFGVGNERV